MNDTGRLTVAIATLGCKVNQSESDAYAQRFADAGYVIVSPDEPADVCVVNSCTVTNVGDQKSRQMLQRVRRNNPDALLAVTGCYASVAPHQVERLTGADIVTRLDQKENLVDLVSERLHERGVHLPRPLPAERLLQATPRTRLNVKVQDGCNDFCSYCIVPFSRGRARSVPPDQVLAQVGRATAEGYREVVLTGVNLPVYGRDFGMSLGGLIESILERTSIERLRLSSIEPFKFDTAWLSLWKDDRLCRHLHLPLQSGCDATLKRMRRRYDSAKYAELLALVRDAIPGVAIWTDVIAGFPGETDEEFEASLEFVRTMEFAGTHVFRYSPRTGTRAAVMEGQLPERIRKERSERLLRLSEEGKRRFASTLLGSTVNVLFEEDGSGLSDTYVRVAAAGGTANTFGSVRVTRLARDGVEGVVNIG